MADALTNLPGSTAATIEQINEILRGATIKQISPLKAIDPDHGGECVRIELVGGDHLILVAVPNPARLLLDEPTVKIQPILVHRRISGLHGLPA